MILSCAMNPIRHGLVCRLLILSYVASHKRVNDTTLNESSHDQFRLGAFLIISINFLFSVC